MRRPEVRLTESEKLYMRESLLGSRSEAFVMACVLAPYALLLLIGLWQSDPYVAACAVGLVVANCLMMSTYVKAPRAELRAPIRKLQRSITSIPAVAQEEAFDYSKVSVMLSKRDLKFMRWMTSNSTSAIYFALLLATPLAALAFVYASSGTSTLTATMVALCASAQIGMYYTACCHRSVMRSVIVKHLICVGWPESFTR